MRGQFIREREQERKKKSGQGTDELYVSKWKWLSKLRFLEVVVKETKGFETAIKSQATATNYDSSTCPVGLSESSTSASRKRNREEMDKKRAFLLEKAVILLEEDKKIIRGGRAKSQF